MKQKLLVVFVVFISFSVLFGCETIDSDDIRTSGIFTSVTVTASGDGTTSIRAVYTAGGTLSNTHVDFGANDHLTATDGTTTKTLSEDKSFSGNIGYETNFATDAGGTVFTISLERVNDDDAPDTNVTLPGEFTISDGLAGAEFSRATDSIVISWSPSGGSDPLAISVNGSCINSYSSSSSDNGSFTINAGQIVKRSPINDQTSVDDTCLLTLTMTKERSGTVDSHFEGGQIIARQIRTVTFTTVP